MNVLVLNVGSSSLKFDVYDTARNTALLTGNIQHITTTADMVLTCGDARIEEQLPIASHKEAIPVIDRLIEQYGLTYEAIGFRIVHGGDFKHHTLVTDEVLEQVKKFSPLAPLHNPIAIAEVEAIRATTDKPIGLIFDTVFYHTLPAKSYTYTVPEEWRALGVRKYGFHGLSHHYLYHRVNELAAEVGTSADRVISCHLGAGSSITATSPAGAQDTSMGFSPLAGIMMGTRTGDIDSAVVEFIANNTDLTLAEITRALNSASGFLGMTGTANVAEVCERAVAGDEQAQLALDIFVKRIADYVAAYYATLGGCDALVFAGGIGENSAVVRERVIEALASLGFTLDMAANARNEHDSDLSMGAGKSDGTRTRDSHTNPAIYVIQTDEASVIASETATLVSA